jgi:flagellar hook-associated protein 2
MAIRLSGMSSGLDTESIVSALVSAYSLKKTNLEKAQTKLSWTQDAWKEVNTKVYSLYTGKLSSMRFSGSYSLKTSSVSDSTVAKVTASSSAVNGNQQLKVKQLASSGYLTGGVLGGTTDGSKVKADTKLSDIKGMESYANGGTIKVKADSTSDEKEISLSGDMTVQQFVTKLKEAGLSANFDSNNQRIFINSSTSGAAGDFSLTGGDSNGTSALRALGLLTSDEAQSNYSSVANWSDEDVLTKAKAAYDSKVSSYNSRITSLLSSNEAIQEANEQIKLKQKYAQKFSDTLVYETAPDGSTAPTGESRTKAVNDLSDSIKSMQERQKELEDKKAAGTELNDTETSELAELNSNIKAATDVLGALGNDTLVTTRFNEDELDADGNATGNKVLQDNDIDKYISGLASDYDKNVATMNTNVESIKDMHAEVGSTYDPDDPNSSTEITAAFTSATDVTGALADSASNTLAQSYINDYVAQRDAAQQQVAAYEAATAKSKAGQTLTAEEEALLGTGSAAGNAAVRIVGQDAEIELNGATFTSNTNNFSINGLTIQALSVNSNPVTITTDTDVDGIYNMIKNFLKDYNEVISYMDGKYNADSSSGYEPLTDDEKESMTDTQIEKWEEKIKDSLLRRDSTLYSISNQMKTNMLKSYTVNGQKYSLSSFGISTLGYFASDEDERGTYHIDGDSDDTNTSGNTDKLRAAIASDPDTVISFFSQLTAGVYNDLTKKMSSTSLSSAYTLYNDKQMKTEYSNYTTKISDWEDKITTKEDYYYSKFTAMETALSKLNTQQSSLSSYFS